MYNFFGYFLAVYIIVFGTIVVWFTIQLCSESRLLNKNQTKNSNKESY
ncbi:MAG: hypothetical protein HON84_05465 [Candidatus Marinimicrobia bacterium]|jgi:hypothetical protein|nr:hypothetical protein [Candidatus Neomarinimicrobiota bacterium]